MLRAGWEFRAFVMGPFLEIGGSGELQVSTRWFIPDEPPELLMKEQAGSFRHGFAWAGIGVHRRMVAGDRADKRREIGLLGVHAGAAGDPQVAPWHGFQGFIARAFDDHDPVFLGGIGFHDGIDRGKVTIEVKLCRAERAKIFGARDVNAVVVFESGAAVVVAGVVIHPFARSGAGKEDEKIVFDRVVVDFRCPDIVGLIFARKIFRERRDLNGL